MNLSNVVLETPLIMEKSTFTSAAILFLQRENSREETVGVSTVSPATTGDEGFRPNYERITLKRPSLANLSLCVICRCDVKYNNQKKVLACEHAFHAKCIKQWTSFQNKCPICMVH
ncbi:RING finger protein 44-like [Anopheles aquasalis]|uniref:RING finger protein 44-like n=1 Tax=Anopheles aquasalis TaxID=42839 RepID=UPI00215B1AC9|nr:RING finger protein 44-like [Anopheles aquasalis]